MLRPLIAFVETWAARGEPTVPARLAQLRALVRYGLLDRVLARLAELDLSEDHVDGATLHAEALLGKGRPLKARKALSPAIAARPSDPHLEALWRQSWEPPRTTLEEDPAEGAGADMVLDAARSHMADGAFDRARALLQRLPDDPRAQDLRWALDDDWTLPESLAELVARWGPDLSILAELPEEAERTDSITLFDRVPVELLGGTDHGQFPPLFRSFADTGDTTSTGDVEHTQATILTDDLVNLFDDLTHHGIGREDTAILRVMEAGRPMLDEATNPGALAVPPPEADLDDLEDEDEDLVILARRPEVMPADEDEEPATASHTVLPSFPTASGGQVIPPAPAPPRREEEEEDEDEPTTVVSPPLAPPRRPERPWSGMVWALSALATVLGLGTVLLATLLWWLLR